MVFVASLSRSKLLVPNVCILCTLYFFFCYIYMVGFWLREGFVVGVFFLFVCFKALFVCVLLRTLERPYGIFLFFSAFHFIYQKYTHKHTHIYLIFLCPFKKKKRWLSM